MNKLKSLVKKIFPKWHPSSKVQKVILIIVGLVFVFTTLNFVVLIVLAITKPEITVSSVKPGDIKNEITKINSEEKYPEYKFDEAHIIEFSNGTSEFRKEYTSKNENFSEGENTVKVFGYKNLFFVKLKSKDSKEQKVEVDRIAPELSVEVKSDDYLLLEDFVFTTKTEDFAKIYNSEKELTIPEDKTKPFSVAPVDGNNKFEIYAQDAFGNKSNPFIKEVTAFNQKNWVRNPCNNIVLPINKNTLQIGYSGFAHPSIGELTTLKEVNAYANQCKTDAVFIEILPKGAKLPCWNCDAISSYINLSMYNSSYTERLKQLRDKTYGAKIITDKEYITKNGKISGRIIESNQYSELEGENYTSYSFIFEHKNKGYTIDTFYETKTNSKYKTQVKNDIQAIIDNMKIIK